MTVFYIRNEESSIFSLRERIIMFFVDIRNLGMGFDFREIIKNLDMFKFE